MCSGIADLSLEFITCKIVVACDIWSLWSRGAVLICRIFFFQLFNTLWGLYAITALGFSNWSSWTILSTDTASLLRLWLVRSHILRQALRQSYHVVKYFLETTSSNSFRWCLSPISSLMSELEIKYIIL